MTQNGAANVNVNTGPSILIIEDNPSIVAYLRVILEAVGFRILVATTGREGLDRVVDSSPAAVLLDLVLPDMHGGSVLRSIRADKISRETPVIVITASEKISDVQGAVACGAKAYVTKPINPASLLTKLEQVLKSSASRPDPKRAYR